jgi:hypothetical protein
LPIHTMVKLGYVRFYKALIGTDLF